MPSRLAAFCVVLWILAIFGCGGCNREPTQAISSAENPELVPWVDPAPPPNPVGESGAQFNELARLQNIRVGIERAAVEHVELVDSIEGKSRRTRTKYLVLELLIENLSETIKSSYRTWDQTFAFGDVAILRDDFGNNYKRVDFGFGSKLKKHTKSDSIYPGKSLADAIAFEIPTEKAQSLYLELPGRNCGVEGSFRFKIKTAEIVKESGAAKPDQQAKWTPVGEVAALLPVGVSIKPRITKPVWVDNQTGRAVEVEDNQEWLVIDLIVVNGSKSAKVEYKTWWPAFASGAKPTMLDEFGNSYKRAIPSTFKVDGHIEGKSIYPEEHATDSVAYQLPVGAAKKMFLELPGSNCGLEGSFRFVIDLDSLRPKKPDVAKLPPTPPLKEEPKGGLPPIPLPEPKPGPDPIIARKAAYIRIHAAIAKVEADALAKYGKTDTIPAKAFVERETPKALAALANDLIIVQTELDRIRGEGDEKGWPKK